MPKQVTQRGASFGTLTIKVIEARKLPTSKSGRVDAWVKTTVGEEKKDTKVVKRCTTPSWNETFEFNCDINNTVQFTIYDKNLTNKAVFESDTRIGRLKLRVSSFIPDREYDRWLSFKPYMLKNKKNVPSDAEKGDIHVIIQLKVAPATPGALRCKSFHYAHLRHSYKTDEYELPLEPSDINKSVHALVRMMQKWIEAYSSFDQLFRISQVQVFSTDKSIHGAITYLIKEGERPERKEKRLENGNPSYSEVGYKSKVFHTTRPTAISTKWVAKNVKADVSLLRDSLQEAMEKGVNWVGENASLFDKSVLEPSVSIIHTNKTYHTVVFYYGKDAVQV